MNTQKYVINKMPANMDLDILVHRALGYEVLGWAECWEDTECGGYYYLTTTGGHQSASKESELQRPVSMKNDVCMCSEDERPSRIFGHIWWCLGVVPEYSTNPDACLEAMERMAALGWLPGVSRERSFDGDYWESHMGHEMNDAGYGASSVSIEHAVALAIADTLGEA